MFKRCVLFVLTAMTGLTTIVGDVLAQQYRSEPWQWWLQAPRSATAERIHEFHNLVFFFEVAIVVFVLVLMVYICVKFSRKNNPVPSRTTHNTLLEVIWTGVPILVLLIIAVPSLKLLYYVDSHPDPEMTIKVIGNQWYWSYEYPEHGEIAYDSIIIDEEDLQPGQPRLLSVDNPLVVPVDTNIRVLQTSNDVIHNWAVPSLMLKTDNTPGRINETWMNILDEGTYYGMCSELCGINHGFMPIQIEAVSADAFDAWITVAREEFARTGDLPDVYAFLKAYENRDSDKLAQLAE